MRKSIFFTFFLFSSFFSFSQQNENEDNAYEDMSNNELKVNMTNLIAFKFVDLTYERILNEESSIGASLLVNVDQDGDLDLDEYRKFSFTPYYRHFFSKKYAKGFFVEAFGMLHTGEEENYVQTFDLQGNIISEEYRDRDYTDFAVGISAGGKFVTKRGFIAEVYLGIGRDLLGNSDIEIVGRGGISLGYRF